MHSEDLGLINNAAIPLARMVTIRTNEPALNQQTSSVDIDRGEFVKISGSAGNWSCCFWQEAESSCGIYGERPLECRLLFCEDTRAVEAVMGCDLLIREDILGSEVDIITVVRKHESLFSYNQINSLLSEFLSEPSLKEKLQEINLLVREDLCFRDKFLEERGDLQPIELFLFGRPLFLVLSPYGFRPIESINGISLDYPKNHANSSISQVYL